MPCCRRLRERTLRRDSEEKHAGSKRDAVLQAIGNMSVARLKEVETPSKEMF